jgi:hypothetical protein
MLKLDEGSSKSEVLEAMKHHVVGMSKLIGRFGK